MEVLKALEIVVAVVDLAPLVTGLAGLNVTAGDEAEGVVGEGEEGGVPPESDQVPTQAGAELAGGLPGELDGVSEGEVVAVLLVTMAVGPPPALQGRPGRGGGVPLLGPQGRETHLWGGGPGAGLVVDGEDGGGGEGVAGEGGPRQAQQGEDQNPHCVSTMTGESCS